MVISLRKTPVYSRQTPASLANGLVRIIYSVCQTATDSLLLSHHAVLHLPLAPTHFPKSTGYYILPFPVSWGGGVVLFTFSCFIIVVFLIFVLG